MSRRRSKARKTTKTKSEIAMKDLGSIMKQAQAMQQKLADAQA